MERGFGGRKKTLREWGHTFPRLSFQQHPFGLQKNPGALFWGWKKPQREWGHALPRMPQVPREGVQSASAVLRGNPHHQSSQSLQSSPGFEPGASGVRRPRASPLGNLTTVGHLAKVSPDLSLHFHRFLTSCSTTENPVF